MNRKKISIVIEGESRTGKSESSIVNILVNTNNTTEPIYMNGNID